MFRPKRIGIGVLSTFLIVITAQAGQAQPGLGVPMAEHVSPPPPLDFVESASPTEPSIETDSPGAEEQTLRPSPLPVDVVEPGPATKEEGPPEYPVVTNDRTRHFLGRFTGARREVIEAWFEQAGSYLEMVRETLRRFGLPEDLAFTAMIESGFNPAAVSRAGAKGLWQLMAQTARRYGLRVDRWVDERLDPEKSTIAAAAYFRDLYDLFGSWFLAQAAYNAGETRVSRAILRARTRDYWALARSEHLHDETKDFVPAIQALTLIGRNPDRYGFEVSIKAPTRYEMVMVPPSTDLRKLSSAAGVSAESLETLNRELLRGVTPPGRHYELKVPSGTLDQLHRATVQDRGDDGPHPPPTGSNSAGWRVHVVRPGDTVRGVAAQHGVRMKDLLRWNVLPDADRIRPGDRIRIGPIPVLASD